MGTSWSERSWRRSSKRLRPSSTTRSASTARWWMPTSSRPRSARPQVTVGCAAPPSATWPPFRLTQRNASRASSKASTGSRRAPATTGQWTGATPRAVDPSSQATRTNHCARPRSSTCSTSAPPTAPSRWRASASSGRLPSSSASAPISPGRGPPPIPTGWISGACRWARLRFSSAERASRSSDERRSSGCAEPLRGRRSSWMFPASV